MADAVAPESSLNDAGHDYCLIPGRNRQPLPGVVGGLALSFIIVDRHART
jgi:hypothetical protein